MNRNSRGRSDESWEKIAIDSDLINNAIQLAERDVKASKDNIERNNYDWSFSIAYNAMLQAGRALMFSRGFRPKGESKHVSVIRFLEKNYKKELPERVFYTFNKIRKKRHIAVYEQAEIISPEEAKNALKTAEEFVKQVKRILR